MAFNSGYNSAFPFLSVNSVNQFYHNRGNYLFGPKINGTTIHSSENSQYIGNLITKDNYQYYGRYKDNSYIYNTGRPNLSNLMYLYPKFSQHQELKTNSMQITPGNQSTRPLSAQQQKDVLYPDVLPTTSRIQNSKETAVRENFIEATNQKKFRENKKPAFKRKVNKTFTPEQMEELEKEFLDNESIDKRRRKELSMKLKVSEERILNWFQNRRAKRKKELAMRNREDPSITNSDYLSSLQHGSIGSERPANSLEENNLTKTTIEYDKLQQQHDVGVGENFIEATNHKKFSEYKKPAFKRKVKKNFTWEQIEELEKEFLKNKFIGIQRRKELSMKLKVSEKRILVWFRNRRAKRKRELAMRNRKHLSIENKNYHSPLHHGSNSSERPANSLGENNLTKKMIEYDKLQQQHDVTTRISFTPPSISSQESFYSKNIENNPIKNVFTHQNYYDIKSAYSFLNMNFLLDYQKYKNSLLR